MIPVRSNTVVKDLNSAIHKCMEENPLVYVIGEDVLDPYGGAFKVTAGLSTRFPERVKTTPICEATIVGLGIGASMRGLLPIIEIMFGDFLTLAADQIINHAAKFPGMFNGKVTVPLVIRTPMGGYRGYGPTHSQTIEKHFLGIPGLRVIATNHFYSPGLILETAILADKMPVLFIENKLLYPMQVGPSSDVINVEVIKCNDDYYPIVKVNNYLGYSKNPDITIISYGGTSRIVEEVLIECHSEEIWVDAIFVIDIGSTNLSSTEKALSNSNNILFIEEGTSDFGWSSQIASSLYKRFERDHFLNINTISAERSVIPSSIRMEHEMLPSKEKILNIIFEVIQI